MLRAMSAAATAHAEAPPTFAVGTGRSGTHFIARLFEREPAVAAHHERAPLADSFHRYCVWNRLPVDHAGFVAHKAAGIAADRALGKLSFEASPYLALSIPVLRAAFGARFVLLVRRPEGVVNSYLEKGWYAREPARDDPRLALGYQADPALPHHPFSRLAAAGADGACWSGLSRVGKLAYFWRRLNEATLRDLAALPEDAARVQALERYDWEAHGELARFAGFAPTLSREGFERLAAERPGTRGRAPSVHDWSEAEAAEFEAEVAPLAQRLGYESRVAELRREPPRASEAPSPSTRLRGLLRG
jgi:hypothetical protein